MSDNLLDGEGNVESLPAGAGISVAIGVPLSAQNVRIAPGHLPYSGVYATSEPTNKIIASLSHSLVKIRGGTPEFELRSIKFKMYISG